jgi:hypothetical protein
MEVFVCALYDKLYHNSTVIARFFNIFIITYFNQIIVNGYIQVILALNSVNIYDYLQSNYNSVRI